MEGDCKVKTIRRFLRFYSEQLYNRTIRYGNPRIIFDRNRGFSLHAVYFSNLYERGMEFAITDYYQSEELLFDGILDIFRNCVLGGQEISSWEELDLWLSTRGF